MVAINIDGQIKTFSKLPKTWGSILNYDKAASNIHFEDGFREVVTPQATEGKKLGAIAYDAVNDVFTYPLIDKTAEELEAEKAAKQQAEKEKIKTEKLEKLAEAQLTPEERLKWYEEWKAGAYAIGVRVSYKLKTFENTIEGNTNAPDKGGWIEIK